MLDCRVKGLSWWFSGRISTCHEGNLWSLSWQDPLEKRMATHSSILAWRIPRIEEPCRSMGLKRIALDSVTNTLTFIEYSEMCGTRKETKAHRENTWPEKTEKGSKVHFFEPWVSKITWSKKWQPSPVYFPGKFQEQEDPGGLQSMGLQRVVHNWLTEHTHTHTHTLSKQSDYPLIVPKVASKFL